MRNNNNYIYDFFSIYYDMHTGIIRFIKAFLINTMHIHTCRIANTHVFF